MDCKYQVKDNCQGEKKVSTEDLVSDFLKKEAMGQISDKLNSNKQHQRSNNEELEAVVSLKTAKRNLTVEENILEAKEGRLRKEAKRLEEERRVLQSTLLDIFECKVPHIYGEGVVLPNGHVAKTLSCSCGLRVTKLMSGNDVSELVSVNLPGV